MLFGILYIYLFYSCNNNEHSKGILHYKEINIPVSAPYLTYYMVQTNLFNKGDTLYMGGYNYFANTIDIIDITNKKTVKYIPLEKQGPNPVSYVKDLWIEDTRIIVKDFISLLTLNFDGKILTKKMDQELDYDLENANYRLSGEGVHVGNYRYFYYNPKLQTAFYQAFPKSKDAKISSVGVKYDLKTSKYQLLPIYYPIDFNYDIINSSLGYPQFCQNDSLIIFNYGYSSKVYCYNEITNILNVYDPKSCYTLNETSLKDWLTSNDKTGYELNCIRFRYISFHKEISIYSRVHYGEKEGKMREKYLMLLDRNFEPIVEYKLPDLFATDFYVYGNYIIFQIKPDKNNPEELLKLALVDLKDELKSLLKD